MFFEIEMKSLLTKEQYDRLFIELPKKMKLINEETIHSTRYKPGDVRLRNSDKTIEIVCKEGDPTKVCRKEVVIPIDSKENLDSFKDVFELLGLTNDPPWTKYKLEFEVEFNGYTYIVCLQDIKNFAYILEVEFIDKVDSSDIHVPNLKQIILDLGCEPIEPKDFSFRIKEYITSNSTKSL